MGVIFLSVYDRVVRNRCRLSAELSGGSPDRRDPCLHPDAFGQCLEDEQVSAPDRRTLHRCSRSVGSRISAARLWNRSRTSPGEIAPLMEVAAGKRPIGAPPPHPRRARSPCPG